MESYSMWFLNFAWDWRLIQWWFTKQNNQIYADHLIEYCFSKHTLTMCRMSNLTQLHGNTAHTGFNTETWHKLKLWFPGWPWKAHLPEEAPLTSPDLYCSANNILQNGSFFRRKACSLKQVATFNSILPSTSPFVSLWGYQVYIPV